MQSKSYQNHLKFYLFLLFFILTIPHSIYPSDQTNKNNHSEELQKRRAIALKRFKEKQGKYQSLLDEILLSGNDSECLALNSETNECLLSLKEYNHRLKRYIDMKWRTCLNPLDTSKTTPLLNIDSVRKKMFISKMKNVYENSVQINWEKQIESQDSLAELTRLITNSLRQELSDSTLKNLYEEYYEELYKEILDSTYVVLFSTDSVFLDSISSVTQNNNNLILPYFTYSTLPSHIKAVADTLKDQKWSAIHKTNLGYFKITLNNYITVREEVSFEDAISQLVYLSPSKKTKCNKTVEEVWNYYSDNEFQFLYPDTFDISLKMAPEIYSAPQKKIDFEIKTRNVIAVSNLDFSRQDQLLINEAINLDKDTGYIHLFLTFGECEIKISNIKRGGTLIPFKEVKDSISDILCEDFKSKQKEQMFTKYERKAFDRSKKLFSQQFRESLLPDDMELEKHVRSLTEKYGEDYGKDIIEQMAINKHVKERVYQDTRDWMRSNVSLSQQLEIILNSATQQ